MEPIKSKIFNDPIILLQILEEEKLLVVDAKMGIRYVQKDTLETKGGFKVNIEHSTYSHRVVSFNENGEYFVSLSTDRKESRLYNAKTKKFLAKVDRHHGEVSCVGIDPKGNYMFSCGEDAKTFVVDVKNAKLAFTLPMHRDSIEDIAFSPNQKLVATASYDKRISLFDLGNMSPKTQLKAHTAPLKKLFFINAQKLLSLDKKNVAIIWDMVHLKVICRLQGIHDDVSALACSSDERFLFIGTNLGYLLVYDLQTYEVISNKYIKLSSVITALAFDDASNCLLVGSESGELLSFFIFEGDEKMQQVIQEKRYGLIEKLIEKNPLLTYTKAFSLFNALWERTLQKGIEYLQKDDKQSALKIFESFIEIPSRKQVIQKILLEYVEYPKFLAHIENQKLALAYSLANTRPMYKESPAYRSMENEWKKTFTLAQKLLLEGKNEQRAKELLLPYRGVVEKMKLIQELMTKNSLYIRFRTALGRQNFVIVFELLKLNPFLKEFPEYDALTRYADSLYIKAHKLLELNDTHAAIKIFQTLRLFPEFEEDAKDRIKEIECQQKFYAALDRKDRITAYNLLADCETLQNTQEGKKLQDEWNHDLGWANKYAVDADVEKIKDVLGKYMEMHSKYRSLATVFGWCYSTQIENAIQAKQEQSLIEKGIKNYILRFGLDDQILSLNEIFQQHYPESKLNFELLTKGSMSMWRPSMIVNSILD